MTRNLAWTAVALAALLWGPRPAAAQQLQWYNNPASFEQAGATDLACVDFEGPEVQWSSLTYGDATFSTLSTAENGVRTLALPNSTILIGNDESYGRPPIIIDFAQPVTAVSLDALALDPDLGLGLPGNLSLTVEGSNGVQQHSVPLVDSDYTFIGVTATSGTISRITLAGWSNPARFIGVDNVCYGHLQAAADPVVTGVQSVAQTLTAARQTCAITKIGKSLEDKLALALAYYESGDLNGARDTLTSLAQQIRAQRGKHITPAAADALLAELQPLIVLLS